MVNHANKEMKINGFIYFHFYFLILFVIMWLRVRKNELWNDLNKTFQYLSKIKMTYTIQKNPDVIRNNSVPKSLIN